MLYCPSPGQISDPSQLVLAGQTTNLGFNMHGRARTVSATFICITGFNFNLMEKMLRQTLRPAPGVPLGRSYVTAGEIYESGERTYQLGLSGSCVWQRRLFNILTSRQATHTHTHTFAGSDLTAIHSQFFCAMHL